MFANDKTKDRERELQYRLLFDNMGVGVVMVNEGGYVIAVNKAQCRFLGYTKEELIGMNYRNYIHPEDYEKGALLLSELIKGKIDKYTIERRYVRKGGRIVWGRSSSSGARDRYGRFKYLVAVVEDITARKEAEEKALIMQTRLAEAERLATIGELAGIVGHDLRSPLTGIAGAAYYLKTRLGQRMDTPLKEMIETIEVAVSHSNKIIDDLLEYSKEMQVDLRETNLKSMIADVLDHMGVPENVKVQDRTLTSHKVTVDQEKIRTLFINVIGNAFDAMPTGGTLKIKSMKKKSSMVISFSDTGLGMTREVIEKLWSPLFTTKAKGMGLGLPICKRIVEAHDGTISAKSILGKGSTFTVILPLVPHVKEEAEITVREPEHPLSIIERRKLKKV